MSRIAAAFAKEGVKLIPFVTVGDPDLDLTARIVVGMAEAGADLVELGIPYSDPVADGPVIQASSQRALDRGVKLADVFGVVRAVRSRSQVPLILFTYCNPVFRYGLERFMSEAAAAGADGLIMPDIPPEEAAEIRSAARSYGLDTVFLVAPTSTDERIRKVCEASAGFVYLVAATGVTGVRSRLATDLGDYMARVKAQSRLPVAVGFGVSTPEHAADLARMGADAVVVGSALVDRIGRWAQEPDLVEQVARFVHDLKEGAQPVPS